MDKLSQVLPGNPPEVKPGEEWLENFSPSGRRAYDRFMHYRSRLARSGDLRIDAVGRLICTTTQQQDRIDQLWREAVREAEARVVSARLPPDEK